MPYFPSAVQLAMKLELNYWSWMSRPGRLRLLRLSLLSYTSVSPPYQHSPHSLLTARAAMGNKLGLQCKVDNAGRGSEMEKRSLVLAPARLSPELSCATIKLKVLLDNPTL